MQYFKQNFTRGLSKETINTFALGLCSKGSMAGRIAIPIHNEQGELVAYAGRWPGDDYPESEDKYKLPTGFQKHRTLFNLNRVLDAEHLVIVEGYFGVFRLFEPGIPAVALMGSSIAPEQVELLKNTGVERITVLLDGDLPGRAAAETVVATLSREFFVRTVVLPDDMQPDDLNADALRELLFPR